MVFFVPGMSTASGFPNSAGEEIYLTLTSSIASRGAKSVKLEILGRRITARSTSPALSFFWNLSVRLSSSSMSR